MVTMTTYTNFWWTFNHIISTIITVAVIVTTTVTLLNTTASSITLFHFKYGGMVV